MEIKTEENETPNSSFIDNFANWVGSREKLPTTDINSLEILDKPKKLAEEITHKKPPHKMKKLRVLVKRLKRDPVKRRVVPVFKPSPARTYSRHHDYTAGKYKSLITQRPSKTQLSPRTYIPPQSNKNVNFSDKSIKTHSTLAPSSVNNKLVKDDTTSLTLAPQSNEAKSKTKLMLSPDFKNDSLTELLLSGEEDFLEEGLNDENVIIESLLLDEAARNEYTRKAIENDTIKKTHTNAKAVLKKPQQQKESPKLVNKCNKQNQTKSVQTKFTCNDNICGIIDTQAFNINCFYCYEIFPIRRWPAFISHMKRMHTLDERTRKRADMLMTSIVEPKEEVKPPAGGKRLFKTTNASPPLKIAKRVISDVIDLESDLAAGSRTQSTNKPLPIRNIVKLIPSDTKLLGNRPIQRIKVRSLTNSTAAVNKLQTPPTIKKLFGNRPIQRIKDRSLSDLAPATKKFTTPAIKSTETSANRLMTDLNPKEVEHFFDIIDLESGITHSTNKPSTIQNVVTPIPSETECKDKKLSGNRPIQRIKDRSLPNTATDINKPTTPPVKLEKPTVSVINLKKLQNVCDVTNMESDLTAGITHTTNKPSAIQNFITKKLTVGNRPIQRIKDRSLSVSNAVFKKLPTPPIKSLVPNSKLAHIISGNSNTITKNIDLTNIKKLPSNIKIVQRDKTQTTAAETANQSSVKAPPRVYVAKRFLDSAKSNNKVSKDTDTTEIVIKSEVTKSPPTKNVETTSLTKPLIPPSVNADIKELPKKNSLTKSTLRPLASPDPNWDSDDDISSIDEGHLKSKEVGVDSKETSKCVVNQEITTPSCEKTLEQNSTNKAPQPAVTTTIETKTPKVAAPKSKLSKASSVPFPSRYLDSEDEMPSNDENEDMIPSSTNGCGILFGLTNRKIVLEFLKELENYPDLYNFQRNKNAAIDYTQFRDGIAKLRSHINRTFSIDMTEFEIRLSIQRIKYWYCRTLQKMEQSKNAQKPFKHTFRLYFKIMDKFLSYDVSYTKDLVLGRRFQSNDNNEINRYPTWMVCKQGTGPLKPKKLRHGGDIKQNSLNLAKELQFDEDDMLTTDSEDEAATGCSPQAQAQGPPEPFICDICFEDFNRRLDLKRHRLGHFPPKHACSTCQRMHYSRKSAERCTHVDKPKAKTKSKPPTPATSTTSERLAQNEGRYMCELCGACYKSCGMLNYHKKDKHFNLRHKCKICKFTATTNYRLLQHQRKRHVVEYGTCEEIAKRTRPRPYRRVPYTEEARKEYEWRREMRKHKDAAEHFYGCFKCTLVFQTRKEKMDHNKAHHPIKPTTVVCLLCQNENASLLHTHSVRRHYTDVHKVPWNEIDELVGRTKPLLKLLTPEEIDLLHSCDNHGVVVAQILAKRNKTKEVGTANVENLKDFYDDVMESDYVNSAQNGKMQYQRANVAHLYNDDDDDDGDKYESTLYNDFEVDHDYDEILEISECDDYEDRSTDDLEELQFSEFQDASGSRHFIIEENYGNDYFDMAALDAEQAAAVIIDNNGYLEEHIIEEIVEDDFIAEIMEVNY